MKRRSFRPVVDAMETRIALSSSSNSFFSGFFDSLFGKSSTSDSEPHLSPAQIAKIKAHRQAVREARQARLAELHAAHHGALGQHQGR